MKKILTILFLFAFAMASFAQMASSTPAITNKQPRLVDFGSKQCRACKAMEPVLESCASNHADKFKTEFIDVWQAENQAFAQAHQIQSIPTQVFFNEEGKELFRHTGFISEEDILAKWQELGYEFAKSADSNEEKNENATPETGEPSSDIE